MTDRRKEREDSDLVSAVLSGETGAFRLLVERHQRKVYNLVVRIVKNRETGRDIAQEAFLRAYKSLDTYRDEFPFRSWLYRIARNCAFEHLRRHGRRPEMNDPAIGDESILCRTAGECGFERPEESLDHRLLSSVLERLVGELSPASRAVFVLRHQDGMSLREIAASLDIPVGTVKSRLNYACRLLRARLRKLGMDGGAL